MLFQTMQLPCHNKISKTNSNDLLCEYSHSQNKNNTCNFVSIYFTKVSDDALQSVRVQENGRFVAVGSQTGTTTLMEISSSLYSLQKHEKSLITTVSC